MTEGLMELEVSQSPLNDTPSDQTAASPKVWRDLFDIHPAAELFPIMGSDQLRELGEDIKKNGMTAPVIAFRDGQRCSFLDGRNRLDGMELVGFDVAAMLQEWERDLKDRHHLKARYVA